VAAVRFTISQQPQIEVLFIDDLLFDECMPLSQGSQKWYNLQTLFSLTDNLRKIFTPLANPDNR
jgi:hypothetical protein